MRQKNTDKQLNREDNIRYEWQIQQRGTDFEKELNRGLGKKELSNSKKYSWKASTRGYIK